MMKMKTKMINIIYYNILYWIMSKCFELDNFTKDDRIKLSKELTIYCSNDIGKKYQCKYIKKYILYAFDIQDKYILLPFSYSYQHNHNNNYNKFTRTKYVCNIKLTHSQKKIKDETYDILNRTKSIILACNCGFGKTIYSIFLCYKLKYKALIQVHRINLMIQWENAIKNTCNDAKVQLLTSSNEIQHDCDFYIINMINTSKRNKDEFKDIGILICDEIHLLCTEVYSKTLYSFQPKYLIGLSATPFKNDGSSRLLELYFGPEVIFKHLYRPFNIYSFYSNYIPKYKINNKSIDWNSVLEDLDNNEELFDLYIKVIQYFSTRNILVLVKRINIGK